MIYLLITNRPEWAEFAKKQHDKYLSSKLVVVDNSKEGVEYWKNTDCVYFHVPESDGISDSFNWFVRNHPDKNDHLLLMDDDIEIHSQYCELESFLDRYHTVIPNMAYVTDRENKCSEKWFRNTHQVGATWMLHKDVWPFVDFRAGIGGYIKMWQILSDSINKLHVTKPFVNYIIHDDNLVQKKKHWKKWDLPQINFNERLKNE